MVRICLWLRSLKPRSRGSKSNYGSGVDGFPTDCSRRPLRHLWEPPRVAPAAPAACFPIGRRPLSPPLSSLAERPVVLPPPSCSMEAATVLPQLQIIRSRLPPNIYRVDAEILMKISHLILVRYLNFVYCTEYYLNY